MHKINKEEALSLIKRAVDWGSTRFQIIIVEANDNDLKDLQQNLGWPCITWPDKLPPEGPVSIYIPDDADISKLYLLRDSSYQGAVVLLASVEICTKIAQESFHLWNIRSLFFSI